MKHLIIVLALTAGVASCTRTETYPLGTDVTVQKSDGGSVSGRLTEVRPDRIVVQSRDGSTAEILKSQIASLKAAPVATPAPQPQTAPAAEAAPSPSPSASPATTAEATPPPRVEPTPLAAPKSRPAAAAKPKPNTRTEPSGRATPEPVTARPAHDLNAAAAPPPPPPVKLPEYRELTIPAGTTLSATLTTALASDTSKVEDVVRARLQSAVSIEGFELLPTGATITGNVTKAEQSAKVKGRALLAFRFNSVGLHDGPEHMSTETITREAAASTGKDATKVGIGAGAGAIIGGIVGGGSGAATGAAIGGGAGTATVLATRGEEVRLPAGTPVTVKLTAPLTIRVEVK